MNQTTSMKRTTLITGDVVTYSEFEIAHAINDYTTTHREFLDFANRMPGGPAIKNRRTREAVSKQLKTLTTDLVEKAVRLTRMGFTLDRNLYPRGIRVDSNGLFVELDIKLT